MGELVGWEVQWLVGVVEKGDPKKLNLVRLDGPLGDRSGMTAAERAEILQQDGRRRSHEEIAQAEMEQWRAFLVWGGLCAGGWLMGLGSVVAMDWVGGLSSSWSKRLPVAFMVLGGVSWLGVMIGCVPALLSFVKLLIAMRRRWRLGRSGSLQEP